MELRRDDARKYGRIMTTTDVYCCEDPQLPKGMEVGHGLFGGYRAICECGYSCAYWDCACELVHDCEANK